MERCNLCGSEASSPFLKVTDYMGSRGESFDLVKCRQCGLIYVNPRPPDDQLSDYYGEEYYPVVSTDAPAGLLRRIYRDMETALLEGLYGYPGLGANRRHPRWLLGAERQFFRLLGRDTNLIPFVSGGRLLDVGCGTGEALVRFRAMGWGVAGVEPSEYGARLARAEHGLDVFTGDLLAACFDAESFDVINFNQTLEHMSDPAAVLREAYRILAPGGLVSVRVPNSQSLETRFFGADWVAWEAPRHLYHFNPFTLRRAFAGAGLAVELIKCDFVPGNFLLDLDAWRQRTGRVPVRRRAFWNLVGVAVTYASGYAGRGNTLVAFARKPA